MSTLIVCEKQNAAKRIADILSHGKAIETFAHKVRVYVFKRDGIDFSIIGLRGHILELDYPEEFRRWHRIKPRELTHIAPEKKVSKGARSIVSALKDLAREHENIIIATDYDREGELIGVEGLGIVKDVNPRLKVKRARFSALTKDEVEGAFKNLVDIDYNLSQSAESRQVVDLAWGASLTRFISIASNQSGKDFLSVGRVQSPTLALLVDREKEIESFKPEPYWEIEATMEKKEKFTAKHINGKFHDKKTASEVLVRAGSTSTGNIVKMRIKEKKDKPPAPYNTTAFLRDATRQGFTAARAMSVAEDLYTNGFISYPRTDNTVYPKSLNLRNLLEKMKESEFSSEASELLSLPRLSPTRGKTLATDHPPIHPTGAAKKKDLNRNQWKVYELVVRRFLATLAKPAVQEVTNVEIDLNGEIFATSGLKFTDLGWRRYFPYYTPKEKILPAMIEGEEVKVLGVEMIEDQTKPPNRFGQGALIGEMERLGLGTKSTRHEIIQKLYGRGYVNDSPPRPTPSGIAVIEALEEHARTITRARMTSTLEKDMAEVAEGKKEFEDVVRESQVMLDKVFIILEENKENIGSSIKEALKKQRIVGECQRCGGELLITRSRRGKRFVGCSNFPKCRNSYPLPQKGKLDFVDSTCEKCGAPKIKFGRGRGKKKEVCINIKCEGSKVS
ncbi:MAG: DNA topoisomerase I [Methanomassiliicoccales archaeon]|nr:MAG: DNA topoisomerase I [Methanomassiliicoccales archaeon]